MPRHGVYPAAYLAVPLDDLAGGEVVEIEVTVEGEDNLRVHFDAVAFGLKTTGQGERCFDISNPSGHDVTVANRRGGQDECGRVNISKTADPRHVDFGEKVTFVIEVLNEGTCDLTELVLQDFIPAVEDENGDSHPAFQWSGETDPTPSEIDEDGYWLKWTLGSLLPGEERAVVQLVVEFNQLAADGQRVVNRACILAAELRKPRCTSAGVMVGNPYGEDGPAGPGFWCHAARWVIEDRPKVPVDGHELLAWLEVVDADSEVFSELYALFVEEDSGASLMAAAEILCTPQSAGGAADRLARHLLVLWLNVVSKRLDPALTLGQLCGGDEILPDDTNLDMTVGELLDGVDLGFAGADDEQLTFWSEVVDAVNNSRIPGQFGCTVPMRTSGRQRAGQGNPGGKLSLSKVEN